MTTPLTIQELINNALVQACEFGTADDLVTDLRAEIDRRVTDVRALLAEHTGSGWLPVRILDGFE